MTVPSDFKMPTLTYVLTEERGTVSFNPRHSDTMLNLIFMENVVGTLVKYGKSGRVENYHASSWRVCPSGLRYHFSLHSGLSCEDGTRIDAKSYVESFHRIFRLHIQEHQNIPIFENLVGFDRFRKDTSAGIAGVYADKDELVLDFKSNPDGLFDFLAMPYYGFYCPNSFDSQGRWRDDHQIISSGGWTVTEAASGQLTLSPRQDLLKLVSTPSGFSEVVVAMRPFEEAFSLAGQRLIVNRRIQATAEVPAGHSKFLSTPTDFVGVVLSPHRAKSFQDPVSRSSFAGILRQALREEPFVSEVSRRTDSFYSGTRGAADFDSKITRMDFGQKALRVVMTKVLTSQQEAFVRRVLSVAAEKVNAKLEIEMEDRSRPGWKERLDSLTEMDIRVVRVDIGGGYEPWVTQMMFCSRLGVSFQDPSGRICRLSSNLSDRSAETASAFEQIVFEDAAVIPVFHTSFSWIVSDDLSLEEFSPTSNLLRFEFVRPN